MRTRPLVAALALGVGIALAMQGSEAGAASAPKPAGPGHVVTLRGLRIYYEDRGHGPALILLHGGLGNGDQFEHQFPAFAPHYRLIVPDACAQGRTGDRPGPLSYHAMAEDVLALMDYLKVRTARVMGWSDGGVIGLDLASHHPARVSHLVTFGANFAREGLNDADLAWGDTATVAAFDAGMEKAWRARAPEPDHYAEAITKVLDLWRADPLLPPAVLGRIRAKTLVCAGEHDVIRPEHTDALARAIPGATKWIVPGANHSVMVEKPEIVNPRVLEFLGR